MIKSIIKNLIPDWLIRYRLKNNSHAVALTFDDGPHPINTVKIINILAKEGVRATFFMVGKEVEKYPDIARLAVRNGHAIANHGYTHEHISQVNLDAEIDTTQKVIETINGKSDKLLRPPHGRVNLALFNYAILKGYKIILWSFDPGDSMGVSVQQMQDKMEEVHAGDIILLHDDNDITTQALPLLIEKIRQKRLTFTTIQCK